MTILDKLRNLVRARPPTEEEIAARTEAAVVREQVREEEASHKAALDSNALPPFR
jgi:hypothetical protein